MGSRRSALAALLLLLALPIAGCGDSEDSTEATTSATSTSASTTTEKQTEAPAPGGTDVYFTAGEQFRKVERELPADRDQLTAATEALVEGPTKRESQAKVETTTQIPAGTEVDDVPSEPTEPPWSSSHRSSSRESLPIPSSGAERTNPSSTLASDR